MSKVPQQLFVLSAERMQWVGSQNGRKLSFQVVGHLSLPSLSTLRINIPSPGIMAQVATLGQHHRVAVLVQQNGNGHGGCLVRVCGRCEFVHIDAAAALLTLLRHFPHVEDKLTLAQQRAVVDKQQVDIV